MSRPFDAPRKRMVERHLAGRDITDARVLAAFSKIPREEFVWSVNRSEAYADRPLRIGEGQTISQPYIVALMTQALGLTGGEKVLEIGTGSGYQTALLAELAREVWTVERHESLIDAAEDRLARLDYSNIRYRLADGSVGWAENAPYDAILVAAASPSVPESLTGQLAVGGRLVIPVGPEECQDLLLITRTGEGAGGLTTRTVVSCAFVKLIGECGWPA